MSLENDPVWHFAEQKHNHSVFKMTQSDRLHWNRFKGPHRRVLMKFSTSRELCLCFVVVVVWAGSSMTSRPRYLLNIHYSVF